MIQSAPARLTSSIAPTSAPSHSSTASLPVAIKSVHVTGARTRDRNGSDLSSSLVSNDSSIFDNVSMSDAASIASSNPIDTEDANHHEVDLKYHPPRISSKTYMQQQTMTETIEEDPNEDSENKDQVVGNTVHPAIKVTDSSPRAATPSSPPSRPTLHLTTENVNQNGESKEESPVEMKYGKQKSMQKSDVRNVANGKNDSAPKSPQSATPVPPATPKSSKTQPTPGGNPLTSAKKEKSGFFHVPKLNRSKSQASMQPEAKLHHLKDSIKHVFSSSANNSLIKLNNSPPDSKSPLIANTPDRSSSPPSTKGSIEPTPRTSPHGSPPKQFSSPPPGLGPRRVASAGPNLFVQGPTLQHDETHAPATDAGHKAVPNLGSRSTSDLPVLSGVRRARTLKECGVKNRGKVAGKGATSTVTRTECNGKAVALKLFQRGRTDESDTDFKRRIDVEFEIASSLHHPNVVKTMELVWDEGKHNWAETMEWCGGGDLYSIIKNGSMTTIEQNCCFKQLVRGVAYMHSMGVAHRDIKPENLLLNEEGQLKITDFGVSDIVYHDGEGQRKCHGLCGSEPYMAPEVHTSEEYDGFPLDVWGCGIVYVALVSGGFLWHKASIADNNWISYLGHCRKAQERTAKKIEEARQQRELQAQKEAKEDAHSITSSAPDHDYDKKSLKSDDTDVISRVSSAMSFGLPSPSHTPPNGFVFPGSPVQSECRPGSADDTLKTPKPKTSSRAIKPDNTTHGPLPISAAKGEVKASTPHFPPFEGLQPHQRRILYRILDPNPATRITAAEILKDPWFKEIQCCSFDPDELFRAQHGSFDASKGTISKKNSMPVKHKHPNHLIKPVKR
jgi:serine/threonine protein kinase